MRDHIAAVLLGVAVAIILVGLTPPSHISSRIVTERYPDREHMPSAASAPRMEQPSAQASDAVSFTWDVPDQWEASTGSSMRLASFKMPDVASDISVMVLPKQEELANFNRWRTQLGAGPFTQEQFDANIRRTTGHLGNIAWMPLVASDQPEDQAFLAALIDAGDQTVSVKAILTVATVPQLEESFIAFCTSLRQEGD